jgi:hypothetical protein
MVEMRMAITPVLISISATLSGHSIEILSEAKAEGESVPHLDGKQHFALFSPQRGTSTLLPSSMNNSNAGVADLQFGGDASGGHAALCHCTNSIPIYDKPFTAKVIGVALCFQSGIGGSSPFRSAHRFLLC